VASVVNPLFLAKVGGVRVCRGALPAGGHITSVTYGAAHAQFAASNGAST